MSTFTTDRWRAARAAIEINMCLSSVLSTTSRDLELSVALAEQSTLIYYNYFNLKKISAINQIDQFHLKRLFVDLGNISEVRNAPSSIFEGILQQIANQLQVCTTESVEHLIACALLTIM